MTPWTPAKLYIKSVPTRLLVDTDMSIDVDDLLALCVAHALADRNEVELLAMLHGTGLESPRPKLPVSTAVHLLPRVFYRLVGPVRRPRLGRPARHVQNT